MTDTDNDIVSNIFEKLFKVNDVASIDNLYRAVTILSKERFENKNEKLISDELINKAVKKLNMTS